MNVYEKKRQYVKMVSKVFSVLKDVGGIVYAHMYATGKEYVRIKDAYGNATFLDVTGHDFEQILIDVLLVSVGQKPENIIKSKEVRKLVEDYFKEKGWHYD